jgi:peptidylprolyl isomerase
LSDGNNPDWAEKLKGDKMKMMFYCLLGFGLMVLLSGCGAEKIAEEGDIVKVHYTGTLEDGTQFDSSEGREPLEFTIGSGMMIPGFDNGVRGMQIGEKRNITLPPSEAYGQPNPELVRNLSREGFASDVELQAGMKLTMQTPDGRPFPVTVIEVFEDSVIIDANHELAGKTLIFEVEMVEIVKPK